MEWNLEQDFVQGVRIGEIGRNETRSRGARSFDCVLSSCSQVFHVKAFRRSAKFSLSTGGEKNYESAQTLAKKKLFEKFQRAETKGESRRNREGGSSRGRAGSPRSPWSRLKRTEEKRYAIRNAIQTMGGGEAESERKKFKGREIRGAINRERKRE